MQNQNDTRQENETIMEYTTKMLKLTKPSLSRPVCTTLTCLGPIGFLILGLLEGDVKPHVVILSVVCSCLIPASWFLFVRSRRQYNVFRQEELEKITRLTQEETDRSGRP